MPRPHRTGGRTAAATVELAVLLPLLVFLMGIGVDYARVFSPYTTITNAARSGALYGSAGPGRSTDDAGMRAAALADAAHLDPPPEVLVSRVTDGDGDTHVEVTVLWTFQTVTGIPGIPSTVNLSRTVQMRVAPGVPRDSLP